MAHVSNLKKEELKALTELVNKHRVVGIMDLSGLASEKLHRMKARFRDKLDVKVSKKSLMKFALENADKTRQGIAGLAIKLDEGIPAFIFSNDDPFKISKMLAKNKSMTLAKAGQMAPNDIYVNAGPTSFTPGPVIGELSSAGLKTAVEGGKIVIKEDKLFVKKGEVIDAKKADVLSKLGIEPMEIKVKLLAMFEDGNVYNADVLDINEDEYIERLKIIAQEAFNLAINTAYTTKQTTPWLIKKAYLESLSLKNAKNIDDNGG